MKHPTLHDTELDAATFIAPAPKPLTRAQKRARWAQILEAAPDRIRAFDSIELIRPSRRTNMRADQSALALAFADPVLREAGLAGDTYGEGRVFFELSHNQMHKLMCRCHIGSSEPGRTTAARLRRLSESVFAPIGRACAAAKRMVSARFA